jgi:hypothetical protein
MTCPRADVATRRHLPALAAAAGLALAGCAAPSPRPTPVDVKDRVVITFKADAKLGRNCPDRVTVVDGSRCAKDRSKTDCVELDKGAWVRFVAELDGTSAYGDLEFSLDFDPFKKGGNPFKGKHKDWLDLKLDQDSPGAGKAYTYNVFSGTCPVIDPQIIIR